MLTFSLPEEIISTLLNYGIHPKTKAQILKKETVAGMMKDTHNYIVQLTSANDIFK